MSESNGFDSEILANGIEKARDRLLLHAGDKKAMSSKQLISC